MAEQIVVVGMGDMFVGKSPGIVRTNLGSCVAVCLFVPSKKVGGLVHCMMPTCMAQHTVDKKLTKYVDTGIDALLAKIKSISGVSEGLEIQAKLFGGAKILVQMTVEIGNDNATKAREILKEKGIRIVAEKIGGVKGYKVDMNLETGGVACQVFGQATEGF
jgi:chemotaxis protein CheD